MEMKSDSQIETFRVQKKEKLTSRYIVMRVIELA